MFERQLKIISILVMYGDKAEPCNKIFLFQTFGNFPFERRISTEPCYKYLSFKFLEIFFSSDN